MVRASYREESRKLLDYIKTFNGGTTALVQGDGPDADACASAFRTEASARGIVLSFDGTAQQWLQRKASGQTSQATGAVVIAGDSHNSLTGPQNWNLITVLLKPPSTALPRDLRTTATLTPSGD